MADYAHKQTDKELAKLEKRIASVYRQASNDLEDKIDAYFESFAKRDEETKSLIGTVVNGKEYTENDYKQWRFAQMGRGERYIALQTQIAERMTKANETAAAYMNDATPGIYSLNRNYSAYTIEQVAGDVGFTLWDEHTVKRLIKDQPNLMPYYPKDRAVKRNIDLKWGKQQITKQVTTGILQGESIKHLSDRLQKNIPNMNRDSAIRAARTAVTGAQNAGRMDSYKAAEDMGIKLKKEWLATLDNRTRHEHAKLDGQVVETDEPFEVDGYELMFPGDPDGAPEMVYNCRCTMIADIDDISKDANPLRRAIDPETGKSVLISDMTYAQWESWKSSENQYAWEVFQKQGRNYSSDQKQYVEYKKILGKNIPNSFAEFQNLKYNNTEQWKYTKSLKNYIAKYPTSNYHYFDAMQELKEKGIKKGVLLPAVPKRAYILPSGKYDPYHIMHRMVERNITDDQLRGYVSNANAMFSQWRGQRQLFVSDEGMAVIEKMKDSGDWIFKTAWKIQDNDEDFDEILEVLKKHGI